MRPSHDSSEWTSVPPSFGSNLNTWTALMPIVVPVHPISRGGSTTWSVEVKELGPDFHRDRSGWGRPLDFHRFDTGMP
jgi:hypothetical protein